jgi:hypothetical protein
MNVDQYTESHLQRLFAEDARIAELGIRVVRVEGGWVLCGEVESAQRREMIEQLVTAAFPDMSVRMGITITGCHEPGEPENVSLPLE